MLNEKAISIEAYVMAVTLCQQQAYINQLGQLSLSFFRGQ